MPPRRKEISIDERKIIIKLWQEGKSNRQIGQLIGRSHCSVYTVIKNFKTTGIITSKPRSGRPPKLTLRENRTVLNMVKKNPRITAVQISQEVQERFSRNISVVTARRLLRRAGFHGRVARKKPYISLTNRKKRIAFANKYVNMPNEFWNDVLFSDETKYCVFGIKGRKLVWRKKGEAYNKNCLFPTVKHGGGGVMLWGCMSANGPGNLEFVETTMDRHIYLDILKRNMRSSAEKLGLSTRFHFQHDNDPKHTAEIVRLWLLYNAPKILHTPPQSPDLNPIEHLWALLENKIRKHTITSVPQLKEIILKEWGEITPQETSKLVGSMKNRLVEVLKHRGYPTRY